MIIPHGICSQQTKRVLLWTLAGVVLFGLGIGLGIGLWALVERPAGGDHRQGAVTAIAKQCADIGRDVLADHGSAVDAALATLFCETVATPQSMGLGGGFVGVVYNRATRQAHSIIARETAPAAATQDMFKDVDIVEGIRAMAVPGELLGYAELHTRFGRLPWRRVLQPAIDMCRQGYPITPFLAKVLHTEFAHIVPVQPEFRKIFWNEAEQRLVREGELVRRVTYGKTLELIATEGARTMYAENGTVAQRLVQDVRELGGLLTLGDLSRYRTVWGRPEEAHIMGGRKLFATPLPSSGSVLVFIMNMLDGYLPAELGMATTFYQRIIETFKFAYAKRSDLGDPAFVPEAAELARNLTNIEFAREYRRQIDDGRTFNETQHYGAKFEAFADHGTAQVSVLSPDGDAVSITSTVNTYFGCKIFSPSTGIVLNDQMDDFSVPGKPNFYGLPPSPSNYIAPGKRPMSSMCPAIMVNTDGDVELVVGAAGGSKITTAVATMIVRHLVRNQTMQTAMREPRLHHQLVPMRIMYEDGFDVEVLKGLRSLGHGLELLPAGTGFASVAGISSQRGHIEAVSDSRRNGSVAYLWN